MIFIPQIEVAETGQLDLFPTYKCRTKIFKQYVYKLSRFSLVQSKFVEQRFRHIRFGKGHLYLFSNSGFEVAAEATYHRTHDFIHVGLCKGAGSLL